MSIVIGKEAMLREANIAAEQAGKTLEIAVQSAAGVHSERAASEALLSIAASAREQCCLARLMLMTLQEAGQKSKP